LEVGAVSKDLGEEPMVPGARAPELAQLHQTRALLHRTYGQIILALSHVQHYQNVPLSSLSVLILEPLLQDRLVLARSSQDSNPLEDDGLLGIVVWATVSEAVDAKIKEQIKAKRFPVKLEREDWRSGDIHWLLDVIAPNEAAARKVIVGLGKIIKAKKLHVHPRVQKLLKDFAADVGMQLS
jgi:cytolysin-activating lysine-acyltransferase